MAVHTERWAADHLRRHLGELAPKAGVVETEGLEPVESFSIVTAEPSSDINQIHDRMPVLIESTDIALWLDPDPVLFDRQIVLLRPAPTGTLQFHPVSKHVNSSRNEGPECIEPVTLPTA